MDPLLTLTHLPTRPVTEGELDQNPPKNPGKYNARILNICTFNVRSLSSDTRLTELKAALQNFKHDIIGLSEVRRLGEDIIEDDNHILYHFGETKGRNGVGFLVKKQLKVNISAFIGISERVCTLHINIEDLLFTIIQAYAPTESSSEDDIEKFYQDLAKAHDSSLSKNIITMGDFNAQIGAPSKYERVTGKFGYGKRNSRGERLIQFAHEHDLKIINTMFNIKPKDRWTWISPDKNTRNEIDYIMSTTPYLFAKYEVVAAFPFGSDHRLLRSELRIKKMKKSRRNFSSTTNSLKTPNEQEKYLENLSKYIPELLASHEKYNNGEYYKNILRSILESLRSSKKIKNHKILSNEALKLMKERSQLQNKTNLTRSDKEKLKDLYKATNKEIRRCYKAHRENTIQKHLNKSRSTKKAYKELNKYIKWIPTLKTDSNKTNFRTNIIEMATDFYAKLYTKQGITTPPSSENENKDYSTIPEFSEIEILNHIKKLKPEKCPGPDGITNECIKLGKHLLLTPITILWNKILTEEKVPQEWTESEIILLYKKGDPADIKNYRPISLMPCLYKLFASCLLERIEQAGFRSGYSTIDHIQVVDLVIEKHLEFRKPLYLAFIDYQKAFDSISHNSIWEALRSQGINEKYINILTNIYTSSTSRVKLDRRGKTINIDRGVRQGDPISPKIFIAVLQHIMRDLPWLKRGININGNYLSNLRFADDIILFAESPQQLQSMIDDLHQTSIKIGLEMNIDKTKILTNHQKIPIIVNSAAIEYVESYVYLGKQISFKKERKIEEINRRIALAWKKYWAHKEIFKSKNIPLLSKKIIMDSEILPCLTYGCQTWTYDLKTRIKIQTTQRKMERSYLNIKLKDKIKNNEIRMRTKISDALTFSLQRKWKWAGHVARYNDDRWTIRSTTWAGPTGTRARGRPRARWADEIEATAGKDWQDIAKDRENWNSLEEAFTLRGSIQK